MKDDDVAGAEFGPSPDFMNCSTTPASAMAPAATMINPTAQTIPRIHQIAFEFSFSWPGAVHAPEAEDLLELHGTDPHSAGCCVQHLEC